jgi:Asp-tRNA(Asn)/Glu-tRNA(Gln) amidotransferase A subunit family amidase
VTVAPRPWNGDAAAYLETTARLAAEVEPTLRAFTHLDLAGARAAAAVATGPLAGMPFAVKEIIDVAAAPVGYGSAVFAGRVPDQDAEAVRRLRAAGAVVAGITTSTPFACGTTTVTTNPHRADATPGGSSAGSGAAVGAGLVPLALASQSQASTLRPAAYCGAWGFKPTHLRLPRAGMHLLSDTLDDLGLIAASVADLTAAFTVLADDPRPATVPVPLRVARVRLDDGGLPRPATLAALDALVERLAADPRVVLVHSPAIATFDTLVAGSGRACFDIFAGESAPTLARHIAAGERDPRLAEMVKHAARIGEGGLSAALHLRKDLREQYDEAAGGADALLTLAATNPAPAGHATTGCRRMPATSSLLGVPALSAPWLVVDGMPQGVQLLAAAGRDDDLLAAAALLDTILKGPTG